MKPRFDRVDGSKRLEILSAYRKCFLGDGGIQVMEDLENFCNYNKSLYVRGTNASINEMLIQEGKRLVFLRILKLLKQAENI